MDIEADSRDDEVKVGMEEELLVPRVEDGCSAVDWDAEPARRGKQIG